MHGETNLMNATLEFEINKAIEKSLPSELGNALKKRLEDADKFETDYKGIIVKYDMALKEKGELKDQLEKAQREIAKHAVLEARENAVRIREEKAAVTELETKLKAEEKISAALGGALAGLVRNAEYRTQVFTSVPLPIAPGGYGTQTGQGSETRERKQE
jgi:hypothetical protein